MLYGPKVLPAFFVIMTGCAILCFLLATDPTLSPYHAVVCFVLAFVRIPIAPCSLPSPQSSPSSPPCLSFFSHMALSSQVPPPIQPSVPSPKPPPPPPLSSQVLQSRLTIARTASSPAHVDFEYSDTLCGTAWRDDYIRLHSAIRSASAAAYTPPPSPTPPPPASSPASHSSRRLLSLANSPPLPPPAAAATVTSAAAAAATSAEVSEPSLSNQTLPASPIRFLTFDQSGHCGGFGDFLVGLVSSFVAALLDRRAFVIRHNCIQYAFEPAFIDWRPSPDVPMEPSRRTRNLNESFSPGMLTKGTGEWADAFRAMGLRPPYAFGCILRFLVRPRKEVWPLTARLLQEMREVRTVVVGVHVRLSDSVVRDPHATAKSVTPASMAAALEAAAPILACAKAVEDMWYPPPLTVRWMLITNSIDLKTAIRSHFPGKILETNFVPRHSQAFGNKGKEQEREEAEQGYREMVAEWLLLSSSNSVVLPVTLICERDIEHRSQRVNEPKASREPPSSPRASLVAVFRIPANPLTSGFVRLIASLQVFWVPVDLLSPIGRSRIAAE
ncbi:unnamed protein product [Closterium sp. Naga37s-1]|nr:unnamed protein product [Closterium sp. Naga37s-1]